MAPLGPHMRGAVYIDRVTRLDLPAAIEEFLRLPNPAVVACVRPDGMPMSAATWYELQEDGRVLLNMNESRRRLGWMRRNPKVSLTVLGMDWYRHVTLHGLIVKIAVDADLADIDRLAIRYGGEPFANRTARRVSAWMEPSGWHAWDPSGELLTPG